MFNNQLVTIYDMSLFFLIKTQFIMNIYNKQQTHQTNKFEMAVQNNVADFIFWVRDLQQRQGLIIYTLWT